MATLRVKRGYFSASVEGQRGRVEEGETFQGRAELAERMPDVLELVEDGEEGGIDATDAARDLAEEHGIDISDVRGTGADGRITKGDVQARVDEEEEA